MDEEERQYMDRIEHRDVMEYEIDNLSYGLPEWIKNLKTYFEKKAIQDDYASHS